MLTKYVKFLTIQIDVCPQLHTTTNTQNPVHSTTVCLPHSPSSPSRPKSAWHFFLPCKFTSAPNTLHKLFPQLKRVLTDPIALCLSHHSTTLAVCLSVPNRPTVTVCVQVHLIELHKSYCLCSRAPYTAKQQLMLLFTCTLYSYTTVTVCVHVHPTVLHNSLCLCSRAPYSATQDFVFVFTCNLRSYTIVCVCVHVHPTQVHNS